MSKLDLLLVLFSALIFAFAVHETADRLGLLSRELRRECRRGRFHAKKGVRIVTLMAISIGPAGYYGIQLLREIGLV
jgi:hypothetical protein